MEEPFTKDVIDDFVAEYARGRTPNPCVRCNSNTKIPDLLRRGRMFGARAIATGHYARSNTDETGRVRITRGVDAGKDQTYFLWGIPPEVVPHLLFPVGALAKSEVRAYARRLGLSTADKPESQEICFVPDGDYAGFLRKRLGTNHPALERGEVVTRDGSVVGEHDGYARFTVGQRRGLGGGFREPLYVLNVDADARRVIVGTRDELSCAAVELGDLNWIAREPVTGESVRVQMRHRAVAAEAVVETIDASLVRLRFAEAQKAVTPGQSGVLYRGDQLIGGGRILRSVK
jgi:tRNA-specific 2-thiouridylase